MLVLCPFIFINTGEHGDTQFPLFSAARVGPTPILDWKKQDGSRIQQDQLDKIGLDVKNAAYKIIEGKGATNYAIGVTAAELASAILKDSNSVLPVSRVLESYHGISGVAISVPTVVNRTGAAFNVEVPMTDAEIAKLRASAAAVQASLASLGY